MLSEILNNDTYKQFTKSIPFPIRDYAAALGLIIQEEPLVFTMSGKLQDKVITVNSIHIEKRKNFTIAHEIAHYLLNHGDKEQDYVNRESELNYTSTEYQQEEDADLLASEILLVEEDFKQAVDLYIAKNEISQLAQENVRDLAKELAPLFATSKASIIIRLKALGYISQWEWIYFA